MNKLLELRAAQLISPFGVGAIIDSSEDSFIVTDITRWPTKFTSPIKLQRLETRLNKKLKAPPTTQKNNGSVLLARFPLTVFCNKCKKIQFVNKAVERNTTPTCLYCNSRSNLVPMRFVAACKAGHLSDIPWKLWAHSRPYKKCTQENSSLRFIVKGKSGGLESLYVSCSCGAERSLAGITAPDALKQIGFKCSGKQPWQSKGNAVNCEEIPRAIQRGASNLYYPVVASALDIPIGSSDTQLEKIKEHNFFDGLLNTYIENPTSPNIPILLPMIAEALNLSPEAVLRAIKDCAGEASTVATNWFDELAQVKIEEWNILTSNHDSTDYANYVSQREAFGTLNTQFPLSHVNILHRLREVRAFLGFHRITPQDFNKQIEADCGKGESWRPAVEVFGEGIFIEFNNSKVVEWEKTLPKVTLRRIEALARRKEEKGLSFLPDPTPRFIALHTFAHLLIRQLSFQSGYASSSLKENIYSDANEQMAGVLIYTADGDSEGSLGGLARMGKPEELVDTISLALDRARWCSADPVCLETNAQGLGGLNKGACHACSLVSETSCVHSNTLLDRSLLFGNSDEVFSGLFTMENL